MAYNRAGIRVIRITGDHPRTAARIAADLGIVQAGATALTGLEIDALNAAAFAEAVRKTSVDARVGPRTSCVSSTRGRQTATSSR